MLFRMVSLLAPALCLGAHDWALSNFPLRLEVEISNPGPAEARTLAVVQVRQASQVALRFPGSFAIAVLVNPPESAYPVTVVPSQADDLDGDGSPDEFVFPVELRAGETRQAHIYYSTTLRDDIPYPKRVDARHNYGYNYQTVALESEEIGYRTYGGFFLDIQARRAGHPGLYNNLAGYFGARYPYPVGMDVIHIGDTLGLGGFFLRSGNSVFRPPLNMPDYAHKPSPAEAPLYRVLARGPVRAVVEAWMDSWKIGAEEVAVKALYSIAQGSGGAECRLELKPLRLKATYDVGAGIRHLPGQKLDHARGRLALSGKQTDRIGPLAMAVYYSPDEASPAEPLATGESGNEIVVFREKLAPGRAFRCRYSVAAAWSGSGIADLFAHLQAVEKQLRARVVAGQMRLGKTPEPQRVEGEAH